MKIKFTDVQIGDVILRACNGKLRVYKVIAKTKANSLKCTYFDGNSEGFYYGDGIEVDCKKHNKTAYIQDYSKRHSGVYQDFFWLIKREIDG